LPVEDHHIGFLWRGIGRGTNLYATACVCVRSKKPGQRKWHFQLVATSDWNLTLRPRRFCRTSPSTAGRFQSRGARRAKQGFSLRFDRVNGPRPGWPIAERPATAVGDVPARRFAERQGRFRTKSAGLMPAKLFEGNRRTDRLSRRARGLQDLEVIKRYKVGRHRSPTRCLAMRRASSGGRSRRNCNEWPGIGLRSRDAHRYAQVQNKRRAVQVRSSRHRGILRYSLRIGNRGGGPFQVTLGLATGCADDGERSVRFAAAPHRQPSTGAPVIARPWYVGLTVSGALNLQSSLRVRFGDQSATAG